MRIPPEKCLLRRCPEIIIVDDEIVMSSGSNTFYLVVKPNEAPHFDCRSGDYWEEYTNTQALVCLAECDQALVPLVNTEFLVSSTMCYREVTQAEATAYFL